MPAASTDDPQSEVDQRDAELAHTRKIQADLWSHDIYLNARRKITTGVVSVLSIVGIASAGALYKQYTDISDGLSKYAQEKIKENMEEKVNAEIQEKVNSEVDKLIEIEIRKEIEKFYKEVNIVKKELEKLEPIIEVANNSAIKAYPVVPGSSGMRLVSAA